MKRRCLVGLIVLFFPFFPAPAAQDVADVVFLSNEEYLPVLLETIRGANRSIDIEMYLIRPGNSDGHPVNVIVSELAAARRRGVQVSILMDSHFESDNLTAADRFKSSGVWDVRFDRAEVTNHTKLVIIDDETVILGSQNWTLSALAASNESAVMVRSADVVTELKQKLKREKAGG